MTKLCVFRLLTLNLVHQSWWSWHRGWQHPKKKKLCLCPNSGYLIDAAWVPSAPGQDYTVHWAKKSSRLNMKYRAAIAASRLTCATSSYPHPCMWTIGLCKAMSGKCFHLSAHSMSESFPEVISVFIYFLTLIKNNRLNCRMNKELID